MTPPISYDNVYLGGECGESGLGARQAAMVVLVERRAVVRRETERGDRTPSGPGDLSNHPPALRPPPDHRIRDAVLHTGTSPRNPVGLQVSASRMPAGETVPGRRCFHALAAPIGDPIAGCPRSRGIVPAPVGNDEGGPAWGAPAHPVERADRFGGRGTREETVLLLRLVGARSWEMQ